MPWKLMASPKLTVVGLVTMALFALAAANDLERVTAWVILPLAALMINLVAALIVHPRLRTDTPLLLFHLALLTFFLLLALARLVYFDGGVRLTTGVVFNGKFETLASGPLHHGAPESLRFAHEGLTERAPAGGGYPVTHALVTWWDGAGRPNLVEIGNDRPLTIDGYRIFATSQRGFSPLISFQRSGRPEQLGTAQLSDAYRERGIRDFTAGTDLALPGGRIIWVQVKPIDSQPVSGPLENLGADQLEHVLIVRDGEQRYEMRPGESVSLADGRLTYVRLSTWMGYRVTYDPTPPWLAASIVLGVASLCWFYFRLAFRRPAGEALLSERAA